MNWGWVIVYALMVLANDIMCLIHGFDFRTWQFGIWNVIMVLAFVSGASYRKK